MRKCLGLAVLGMFVGLATGAACSGGSNPGRKDSGADATTGDASDGAGGQRTDAAADAPDDSPVDSADASTEAAADASDASIDEPSDAADGADTAQDTTADAIDAGEDCLPPSSETALMPTAEGLPADGLVLWLRGDHGVYKTAAQAVCAWADQSANHFLLTDGSIRPVWEPTGLGAQPAVHFTGGGQQLGMDGVLGLAPTAARTFIAVSILVQTTVRFQPIFQGQIASAGTYVGIDENTFNTAGSREGVYAMNNAYDATLATAVAPRIHVYTLPTMTPGTPILPVIDYRVNGVTQTLTRNAGGLGNGNFEDFTGANATSVGSGTDGFIAEVLVYGRALSVDERASVEAALKARYGIQ